ncbi:hypothetical protein A2W24_03520 [Microgenomates group bacterium RBG_16_45_19]|nr:MAG: hypothetical protein A2W24_03520 [Microgenomates group bacterium RBG_16_45_19]
MVKNDQLQLTIMSPEEEMYSGEVQTVSAQNAKGRFDILPRHENFISIIYGQISFREMDGNLKSRLMDQAVIMVSQNQVQIFTGLRHQRR